MSQHDVTPARTALERPAVTHRKRMRRADLLVILSWASVAIVIALFLAEGAAPGFGDVASIFTSLGILVGLVGTNLILLMLVLAARVPVIDRTFGHDRAMAAHRKIGKPAFYLILAHAALLTIGYGIRTSSNPITWVMDMLAINDIWLSALALALLVVVIVTSLVAVRRRFAYEVWHLIHLLSYLAVLVAIPHQLSVGGLFADGTFQRYYWIGLYLLVVALVVGYRFVEPAVVSVRHRLLVSRVESVAPGVVTITMKGRHIQELNAQGGQFFIWRFWTGSDWWHAHPLSISAAPGTDTLRVTVRAAGKGSHSLVDLPVGTRVSFEGPYGIFTQGARTSSRMLLVAAGIGVTPIRALIEQARVAPGEATVILRGPGDQPPYLWQEMLDVCTAKGAQVFLDEGPRPRHTESWLSADAVAKGYNIGAYAKQLTDTDLYVCGPSRWADLVIADARNHGIKEHQVHVERFDW